MLPKYEDGDLVYIHPNRPIRKGRYVLVETNDHHGLIKKFEKWEGDHLIVSQFNPSKELSFYKDDLQRVMLIIGSLDQ